MFIKDGKRINIYAPFTDSDGTRYSSLRDAKLREKLGITEIPDPPRESTETHFVQEIDVAPYIINTPKPQEILDEQETAKTIAEIEAIERGQARALREAVLTGDKTALQEIDDKIKGVRQKIKPIRGKNGQPE